MTFDCFAARLVACLACLSFGTATAAEASRQALEEAWWTGPILAASASSLPKGHALIEPYVFDAITRGRYDDDGNYRDTDTTHRWGSLTYILYGLTNEITAGLIPTFGYNDVETGADSSGIGFGDLTLQAQYRFLQFSEGRWPTMSFVIQETLPTGRHDRLERASDGFGSGAYATTLALFSQYYFWMPNGRILRTRLNVAYTLPDTADVTGASVYGTADGFQGRASPGDTLAVTSAWEYSVTQNWVLAIDLLYQHDANTRVRGVQFDPPTNVGHNADFDSGSSWRFAVAPAIEYNWNGNIGIIVGARWFAAGRNTSASVTPVLAVNMVY